MLYPDSLLDSLRCQGDPVPDGLVADIAARGETEAVNRLLRAVIHNDDPVPPALPDDVEAWFRASAALPAHADGRRLKRAEAVFVEHGLQMSFILATASLVFCYAGRKGVRVLTYTYRLAQDPYRRAAETAQFVLDVLGPGGLDEGGKGIRAIQKVRLMHAAVRHLIRATGTWPEAELGVPICQEDLLGTLMSFSWAVVEGLHALGVDFTDEETDAYLHLWRIVGEMLGLPGDLIPETMADSRLLVERIGRRQFGRSPDGVLMTRALLEMHAGLFPGELFDGMTPALIRLVVGSQIADWLEIPRTRWDRVVRHYRRLGRYLEIVDRETGTVADLVDQLAIRLLTRASISATGYRRTGFAIPSSLAEQWAARGRDLRVVRDLPPARQPARPAALERLATRTASRPSGR